jgi:hypothetical protein
MDRIQTEEAQTNPAQPFRLEPRHLVALALMSTGTRQERGQFDALALVCVRGYTYAQASALLGPVMGRNHELENTPVGTIKSRIHRGRAKLKSRAESEEITGEMIEKLAVWDTSELSLEPRAAVPENLESELKNARALAYRIAAGTLQDDALARRALRRLSVYQAAKRG